MKTNARPLLNKASFNTEFEFLANKEKRTKPGRTLVILTGGNWIDRVLSDGLITQLLGHKERTAKTSRDANSTILVRAIAHNE